MRYAALVCALALAAALPPLRTPAAAPAPAILSTGQLPKGGTYIISHDAGVAQVAADLWFRAPASGYDGSAPGIAQVAAAACAAAPLASGVSLAEAVRALGGELSIDVYPDLVSVSVSVPASAQRRIVASLTAAYFAPVLNADALKLAQQDAAVLIVERKYTPGLALQDAVFGQLFSSGPARYGALPADAMSTSQLTLEAVNTFARRAFRSDNAVLTLAGDTDDDTLSVVTDGSGAGSPDMPFDSHTAQAPPNVSMQGTVEGIGLGWSGPTIDDEKAATAMDFINDYLFRDGTGTVQRELADAHSTASVNAQFITLHDPGVMIITIAGDGAEAARARVMAAIAALAKPLDARTFAAARAAFIYHIESDDQTPQAEADNLGWYAAEGDGPYAPGYPDGRYLRSALSLDPQYVASIVQRYLKSAVVVRSQTAKESTT